MPAWSGRSRAVDGVGCWQLLAGEGQVGDAAGAGHSLYPEALFERVEAIPQPFTAAQHDGHHDDVQVVHQVSGQEGADGSWAAADPAVQPGCGLPRLLQGLGGAGAGEVERGAALHLQRWPGMVGEDEHRGVKRRVVSPPARPLLVWPGAALRPELIAAHDLRADARPPSAGKRIVHTAAAAGRALHVMEASGGENTLVQPPTRMPDAAIQARALARSGP